MTGLIERLSNAWSPVRREGRETVPVTRNGLSQLLAGSRTEQLSAMEMVGIVFGITDRIASSQAAVEWCLYRSAASGRKEDRTEVPRHLAMDLLRRPNDAFDGDTLTEMGQQHYELTGESWTVVEIDESFNIPLTLWPVRPDRIEPVPGETTFLAGYIYTSVDGERIPLRPHEVLSVRRPHPKDPYRGLSAIAATMTEIHSARAASEWNRNFFRNGAMPGGVIEVPNELGDTEFNTLITRWRESHRGVSRAHRIGVLERGAKFTPVTYSIKDMQMTEVRGMTRDSIMEGFGISRHMLGITEDVNRATAAAGEYMYAKYIDQPRARRRRSMLNNFYLPLFGATAKGLEFDFANLVPEDEEAANAERDSKATAAKAYVEAGYGRDSVAEFLGVPIESIAGLSVRERAEIAQKLYLAVGVMITAEEARMALLEAGFILDPNAQLDGPKPVPALPPGGDDA